MSISMTKEILGNNAGLSNLNEIDKRLWHKAIGSIQTDVGTMQEFEISKNLQLSQKFIFDQLFQMTNLSIISRDIDALVNFKEVDQGKILLYC